LPHPPHSTTTFTRKSSTKWFSTVSTILRIKVAQLGRDHVYLWGPPSQRLTDGGLNW
jgi:hypothetical protein